MLDAFRLDNEIALITGGAGGIGLAVARCMAEAGARVVLSDIAEGALDRAVASLGDTATGYVYDVGKCDGADQLVQRIDREVGHVSILVNNAGNQVIKPALELSDEEFKSVHDVHVMGSFALSRAVAPSMIDNKKGSILFISSVSALLGLPKVIAYSASKTAMLGMVRGLTSEWSPHGVRINAIIPGWTETEILKKLFREAPERREKVLNRTPLGCFGAPEDIGYAAVYLSSKAGRFVTGSVLVVDGGVSIGL